MSPPDEPRPVSDALRRLRRELGTPEPSEFDRIRERWAELVGADLAAHSRPVYLRAHLLRIAVDDPAWMVHFRYLEDQLVERLASTAPRAAVREVAVVADPAPGAGGRG